MFETTKQVYENGWMIQVFFEVSSLSPAEMLPCCPLIMYCNISTGTKMDR